jgi:hypothetical protein
MITVLAGAPADEAFWQNENQPALFQLPGRMASFLVRPPWMHCRKCLLPLASLPLYEQLKHIECCCLEVVEPPDRQLVAVQDNEPVQCPFCGRALSAFGVDWRLRHVDRCAFRADLERLRALDKEVETKKRLRREQVYGPLQRFLLSHGIARHLHTLVAENLTLGRLFLLKYSDIQQLKIPRQSAERLWQAISALVYRVSIANRGKQGYSRQRQRCQLFWPELRLRERSARVRPRFSEMQPEESFARLLPAAAGDGGLDDSSDADDGLLYRNGYSQLAGALAMGQELLAANSPRLEQQVHGDVSEQCSDRSIEVIDLCNDHGDASVASAPVSPLMQSSPKPDRNIYLAPAPKPKEAGSPTNSRMEPDSVQEDEMLLRFRGAVCADPLLYERILVLECVPFQDFIRALQAQHVHIPNQRLLQLLESEGISFSR